MTKYSDIEIQTAKNLLDNGYKWLIRTESGRLYAHTSKLHKIDGIWWPEATGSYEYVCGYVPIFESIHDYDNEAVSLASVAYPQVLDAAEKKYLRDVIRPFRDRIICVKKAHAARNYEQICIKLKSITGLGAISNIPLPFFTEGEMYKGMEIDKEYTLEELGL